MRACSANTGEGTLWPVDAALRPEGKDGPLVRTVASHRHLLRALGEDLGVPGPAQGVGVGRGPRGRPRIPTRTRSSRSSGTPRAATTSSRTSRRCADGSSSTSPPPRRTGSSSWAGAACATSSSPSSCSSWCTGAPTRHCGPRTTLEALSALAKGGYVGREDAADLGEAYRLLRTLEHRIQLYRLRRTHLMPTGEAELRRLGRAVGLRVDPAKEVVELRASRSREVRRIHERLFYRPLLNAAAKLTCSRQPRSRRRPPEPASRRSASATRPGRCATSRRSPRASRGGPRSSGPCCR